MARIRGIDIVWLFFLTALAALAMGQPEHSVYEWLALLALGAVQIAEGHFQVSSDPRKAAAAIGVKLSLCSWLVWVTGGIESSYYLIFLLPIVSGASMFGLGGTLLTTAISAGLYVSFLFYVDFETNYITPEGERELTLRVVFFFLSAVLVNRLAIENRLKTDRLGQAYRELSQAQDEVRRSERLAALGQLSAGLAHEIRNPLGVISASAELLRKNVTAENQVAQEVSGLIRSEVNRTNSLVTRFLDFARPSQIHRAVNDLNEVVGRAISQLRDNVENGSTTVDIKKNLHELPKFSFDPTLVESSVFNLLINGYEAMPSGGTLRVTTRRTGSMAEIEVTDSGIGIPADALENVFNPFFTSKANGVGLGLAMVSKFVDSHGGKISVTSRSGEGSTFRIRLPLEAAT